MTALAQYKIRHETCLKRYLNSLTPPAQALQEVLHYHFFPGGKRFRPILIYLIGTYVEAPLEALDHLGVAIELLHGYSLIHDDLPAMDNDDYRRGKLSCHKAFNEATAILIGDGIQPLAIHYLLEHLPPYLPSSSILRILKIITHAIGLFGMISGQYLDLHAMDHTVSESTLDTIHHLKTGCLIDACVQIALEASPHHHPQYHHLHAFGQQLGRLFQMQDDYLDYYASDRLGKARASDAANDKTTYANLYDQKTLERKLKTEFHHLTSHLVELPEAIPHLHDWLTASFAIT